MIVLVKKAHRFLRWLWASLLASSGCLWLVKHQLRHKGAVVVLMFHRILDEDGYRVTRSQQEILVRECTFRELVAHVERKYEPVDLQEATPGEPSKRLKVALTLDDGWSDNFAIASPIARAYGIPLTIFVCPGLVDRDAPFWPERVVALMRELRPGVEDAEVRALIDDLKSYTPEGREQTLAELSNRAREQGKSAVPSRIDRTLSWLEITEMERAGVKFGSHSQAHQILTRVPTDEARQEVRESKDAIERALGRPCKAFSYPNGNWSPETRCIVAEAGFKLAVTTEPGVWTAVSDPFAIPRSNIYEDNVVGPGGRFSAAMFEYMTIWKSWRRQKGALLQDEPVRPPTAA